MTNWFKAMALLLGASAIASCSPPVESEGDCNPGRTWSESRELCCADTNYNQICDDEENFGVEDVYQPQDIQPEVDTKQGLDLLVEETSAGLCDEPGMLMCDNFNDSAYSATLWKGGKFLDEPYLVEDGLLKIDGNVKGPPSADDNTNWAAEARFRGNYANGLFGLYFRNSEESSSSGSFLTSILQDQLQIYESGTSQEIPLETLFNQWHTVRIESVSGTRKIYIDNIQHVEIKSTVNLGIVLPELLFYGNGEVDYVFTQEI